MTILNWLVENMQELQRAGADSPRRDCLVFLEDILQKNRAWVISHFDYRLQDSQLIALDRLIKRRLKREPLAYIRGKAWFYGKLFQVSPSVMIPRPESEDFMEILQKLAKAWSNHPLTVIDVGTGSGCLAVTTKITLPNAEVLGIDNSEAALKIARRNSLNHKANVEFITSNLLTSVRSMFFEQIHSKKIIILIVNLPYVPDNLITSKELLFEPKKALFSGKDGLDHYRRFWKQIFQLKFKPQHILTESLQNQHTQVSELARSAGYELKQTMRLVQLFTRADS